MSKQFAIGSNAVRDLTLEIRDGETCVLIGPSGGGKSTAMRMVNRLISITEGEITIDGQSVQRLDPVELRRGIGHVIQQIGLFPHMTIEANVGTVPRLLGWERPGEYDSRQCAGSGVIVSRRCPHR